MSEACVWPNGYDEVRKFYGDPQFRDAGHGQLIVDPGWERASLVRAVLPGYDRSVWMHRLIVDAATRALQKAQLGAPDYKLIAIGCFCPRQKKRVVRDETGKRVIVYRHDAPSIHSWAAALDINPETNPFGGAAFDLPTAYVDAFEAEGFVWGGRWKGLGCDPMHFQGAVGV